MHGAVVARMAGGWDCFMFQGVERGGEGRGGEGSNFPVFSSKQARCVFLNGGFWGREGG